LRHRNSPPTWALLAASGLLLGLAYPPNPVGLFGSIGLVPLLYALERARAYRQAFAWSYMSLLLFSALSTWWVGSWQAKADPFLMISCIALIFIHPLFFVFPLLIYRAVRMRSSRLYALAFLPFLWCGGEYLHALTDASYPWLTLGNTQTYNLYYVQFIEFTGVWGLSLFLMLQNCALTAMLFALEWEDRFRRRVVRAAIAVLAVTLIPPFIYGFYVLDRAHQHIPARTITVTAVQPNVNPWDKWKTMDTTDQIAINADLSREALARGRTDMFLWTENAIPYPVKKPGFERAASELYATIDQLGVPVLTGFPDYVVYADPSTAPASSRRDVEYGPGGKLDTFRWDYFNSAGLFVPGRGLTGAYHKMQLVPFGERIPFVDQVPYLMSMLSWDVGISTWAKGTGITTFSVPYRDTITRAASVICFESVYPNIVRKFVDSGANFLTVITNDGWYLRTPGPLQHEKFAQLRAIENRRSVARAANTGISCFIDPYGSIIAETKEDEKTTLTASIELRDDLTLYARWGDWLPQLSLGIAVVLAGYAFGRTRRRAVGSPTASPLVPVEGSGGEQ
jgi:apolipoprotein N-acyltransferase